jgi:Cu/Ag efflux pump CusA
LPTGLAGPGRSPQDVEDQITYPLTIALEGTPGVKTIRSASGFGFSMIFVIFRDEVDYYWARSRVLDRMNVAATKLPPGVVPVLGPDATALGQIYWYTLEAPGADPGQLRSLQDWYVRYQLQAVEGVSEVASIGGFVKQYQIDVHPDKLRAHRVSLAEVYEAVRRSNIDVGAKVVENNGYEFFIRGIGFVKSVRDVENIVIRQEEGTPIFVKNVATVQLGPDFRRGLLDQRGREAVGGVVTMRYGENPLRVLSRVKDKIAEIEPGLKVTLADGRDVAVHPQVVHDDEAHPHRQRQRGQDGETIILLKPEVQWRMITEGNGRRRRITKDEILQELQAKTSIPGVLPTWLQPIQTRIVMLQTGFRAMMGVKIFGADPGEIERIGLQMEQILRRVTGATDIVADRIVGKPYIQFEIDREQIARYGVNIREVQDVIEIAIGGENLTMSVEGRERYPIRVRYLRELRERFDDLEHVLVPTSTGAHVPIAQLLKPVAEDKAGKKTAKEGPKEDQQPAHEGRIRYTLGPQELKSENGLLVGYVTMNTRDRDEVSVWRTPSGCCKKRNAAVTS